MKFSYVGISELKIREISEVVVLELLKICHEDGKIGQIGDVGVVEDSHLGVTDELKAY